MKKNDFSNCNRPLHKFLYFFGVFFFFSVFAFGQPTSFMEMYGNGPQRVSTPNNTIKTPSNNNALRPVSNTYTDRAAFRAASNNLVLEDLAGTNPGVTSCGAVISSAVSGGCYAPGELMPGFELTPSAGTLVTLAANLAGNTFNAFGANSFADFQIITFPNNDVFAVGMDLFNNFGNNVDIRVYGIGNTLITTLNAAAPASDAFFGFISDEVITRIEIQDPAGGGELIMNLEYGNATPPLVPTLSQWGLIILSLLMMSIVMVFSMAPKMAVAGGQNIQSKVTLQNFAFDKNTFFKMWALVAAFTALGFFTAMNVFGYEVTSADPIGGLVATGIVAYMMTKMKK